MRYLNIIICGLSLLTPVALSKPAYIFTTSATPKLDFFTLPKLNSKILIAKNYGLPNISNKGYGFHQGGYGFKHLKTLNDYDQDENATWADTSFGPSMSYGHRPGATVWEHLGWYRGSHSGRFGHASH